MKLRAIVKLPVSLLRDTRALAMVEFAIWLPILIGLVAGAFEVSRAMNTGRQLTNVANSVATMLTTVYASGNTATINSQTLHYAFDSAMITFPGVLSDSYHKGIAWNNDISISMAGVSFTTGTLGPGANGYQANIVWTSGSKIRACGVNPAAVADASSPSAGTLPTDLFDTVTTPSGAAAPNFVVVVDVTYTWTPLVFSNLFGAITMTRSAYVSPRYVQLINYSAIINDGFGQQCPGF